MHVEHTKKKEHELILAGHFKLLGNIESASFFSHTHDM